MAAGNGNQRSTELEKRLEASVEEMRAAMEEFEWKMREDLQNWMEEVRNKIFKPVEKVKVKAPKCSPLEEANTVATAAEVGRSMEQLREGLRRKKKRPRKKVRRVKTTVAEKRKKFMKMRKRRREKAMEVRKRKKQKQTKEIKNKNKRRKTYLKKCEKDDWPRRRRRRLLDNLQLSSVGERMG